MKDVVAIFKALADPTRLRIMLLLRKRELCVCELMFILGMEQSRVSRHMRVLREAGLAEDVRDGRWIIYRVRDEARPLLEGLLTGASRDRIGSSGEAEADARKLDVCVRENVRGCICETPMRAEGT
jgi:ArsR family transcriptional regulator